MPRRSQKAAVAVLALGLSGTAFTTTIPARAAVFVRELERTSKGTNQVSIWERVVYSLIEANNRAADCRTPRLS